MNIPRTWLLLVSLATTCAVSAEPHKLISLTATFLDDGNDASSQNEAKGGRMGDVTVLTESLKPLRDHFNANKDKHRFIAILSPT